MRDIYAEDRTCAKENPPFIPLYKRGIEGDFDETDGIDRSARRRHSSSFPMRPQRTPLLSLSQEK